MNLVKLIKCLFCLVKCSKYLYFIKKVICISAIVLTGVFLIGAVPQYKEIMKKLKVKM